MSSRRRSRIRLGNALLVAATVVGAFGVTSTQASAAPTINECLRQGSAFGYARSGPDHNLIGIKPYYLSVESLLYRCGGYVLAKHIVHVDGRWLDPGTDIHLRVSTKRSDGRWAGADRTFTSGKNRSDQTYYQLRGVGGGLRLTDVHVKHFAEPGQTSFFPPSTAKATYGRWNGPEASPRK
jgi:hypothetical protein